MEEHTIRRYSEIEFQFTKPLTEEQEDIFIGYFYNMKHSIMDRLSMIIHGTDRNPIKAFVMKHLSEHSPMIMGNYARIYADLMAQTQNPGPNDIFVVEDIGKVQGKWIFRMDMQAFDAPLFNNANVPHMAKKAVNLMADKDRQIRANFQRAVLPMMKLRNEDCRITPRFYDEA